MDISIVTLYLNNCLCMLDTLFIIDQIMVCFFIGITVLPWLVVHTALLLLKQCTCDVKNVICMCDETKMCGTDYAVYWLFLLQQHNTELLVDMLRQQFKKNMHEADPEKIQKLKDE